MANTIKLIPQRDISKHLAADGRVQRALREHAKKVTRNAKALLASHRDTGAHQVEYEGHSSTENFGHIDHYIVMTGPAPVSVEFGHRTKNGKWVHGLYIMTSALFNTR